MDKVMHKLSITIISHSNQERGSAVAKLLRTIGPGEQVVIDKSTFRMDYTFPLYDGAIAASIKAERALLNHGCGYFIGLG